MATKEEIEKVVYQAGLDRANVVLANAEIELLNRQIEAERAETARLRAVVGRIAADKESSWFDLVRWARAALAEVPGE